MAHTGKMNRSDCLEELSGVEAHDPLGKSAGMFYVAEQVPVLHVLVRDAGRENGLLRPKPLDHEGFLG